MKKSVFFMFVCFLSLFLSGCQKKQPSPVSHIVTQVDIFCQKEDVQILRHYTDQKKMEYVLLYLRLAESGKPAAAVGNGASGEIYRITVGRAGGEVTEYRQQDHRYFSKEQQPWQELDPEQAEGLYRLMRQLPSDGL